MFKNRFIQPELLDQAEPAEARVNLADLVRINKRFGGYSTSAKLLSRVARKYDHFTLLDVGAASYSEAHCKIRSGPLALNPAL